MKLARTLMIQGTSSSVGKSALVTGLCRLFAQEGYRVAPFKAQNMSLNAAVTRDGLEISRAQAVQAEAAGIEPTVQMNPILLKPQGDSRSQVIVMGRPLAALEAQAYYRHRTGFAEIVQNALQELRASHDLVIIEGAGSPVEINLKQYDLVNMRVAELANAPVLLVGDIDRGGIFAALLGTLTLLRPDERERVKGLIVNKFRGDIALWHEGERMLAERAGVPVLGTLPFIHHLHLAEEDSVALDEGTAYLAQQAQKQAAIEVVLIRLPYLSNYDEFDALAAEPGVHLSVVARPDECPAQPDLIILPGTKNTFFDLAWLWQQGLAHYIRQQAQRNCAILGICGGYQMLGERLSDPAGAEASAGSVMPGLNLLPIETVFASLSDKTTQQSSVSILPEARHGMFAHLLDEQPLHAYQIHVGRSTPVAANDKGNCAFCLENNVLDGWLSADGWCAGGYLHGLFENDTFRHAILRALQSRRADAPTIAEPMKFDRQHEYDRLAAVLRQHLDMEMLTAILGNEK